MEKKLILQIPLELEEKILKTSSKMMVSRPSIIKLAVNEYCDKILNK